MGMAQTFLGISQAFLTAKISQARMNFKYIFIVQKAALFKVMLTPD